VFTRRSGSWRQVAELKGSDTVAGDELGYAVAVSGMTVVVGVYQAGGVGRAYVFTEAAGSWEQVAELKGSDTVAGDDFGYAVAVSGTTVLVGASNASRVYVFTKSATGWTQTAALEGALTFAHMAPRRSRGRRRRPGRFKPTGVAVTTTSGPVVGFPRSLGERSADQLVQLSVAGVVVTVAAQRVAVIPVIAGIEK
jgi:hypothetical protein